jgi:hypothetical protein
MKIRCQRKSVYNEQLLIEATSKTIEFIKAANNNNAIYQFPLQGFYELLSDKLFVLYKDLSEQLILVVEKQWISFNDISELKYERASETAILSIRTPDSDFSYRYNVSELKPVSTLWYSEEDEDVDFGLWLSLIYKSSERKKIILENWGEK